MDSGIVRLRTLMHDDICSMVWRKLWCILTLLFALLWINASQATAQNANIPGLIVSVPSSKDNNSTGSHKSTKPPTGSQTSILMPGVSATAPSAQAKPKVKKQRQPKTNVRSAPRITKRRKHGVAVLVNDEPITHHEVDQRARLLGVNSRNIGKKVKAKFQALIKRKSTSQRLRKILKETIDANRGKSRDQILAIFEKRKQAYAKQLQRRALAQARSSLAPAQRKQAQKNLIEERLKMQEAQRLNILVSLADVDRAISGIAKRNNMTSKKFLANLRRAGIRSQTFKDRIRTQISWNNVIRRRYGRIISVNMADIDTHLSKSGGANDIKLRLHKITLKLPRTLGQQAMAMRLRQGERLQAKFSGCRSTNVLAKTVENATFRNLGSVPASKISEPARSLLVQAKDGEMLPPLTQKEGIVLYAVCGRSNVETAKAKARSTLQRRELEIMGRRHLADLKRDAHIEYR